MRLHKTTSRALNEHEHTKLRALERYGIEVSRKDIRDVRQQIACGSAVFLHRASIRVSIWLVKIRGVEVTIVYDGKRNVIATVLPKDNKYAYRYYQKQESVA